jgi:hypothetical protein
MTVSQPGRVLSDLAVSGTITVDAPDVVIRRSRFTGHGELFAVVVRSGSVHVDQCEISGDYSVAAVGTDDWTVSRCDVHGLPGDGFKLGNHVTLESSWLHDWAAAAGSHADGAQLEAGVVDVTVRNNVIEVAGNSALFIAPDLGPDSPGPVRVEGNVLGGGNYTVYVVDGDRGRYSLSGVSVRDNRFRRTAHFGPAYLDVPVQWQGNVWADTGASISR